MSSIGSIIRHEAGGWGGDLMHLRDSNCVSGRWYLIVRISCWAKMCSHCLTGASVCSTCFIVLLLAGSVQHQLSGHGEKYMVLVLMNLLTNYPFLSFASADFCPRLGMNTSFPVKCWELFFTVSKEPFSAMHHQINVRRQVPWQEMCRLKMVYLFMPKNILLRGKVDVKLFCFIWKTNQKTRNILIS